MKNFIFPVMAMIFAIYAFFAPEIFVGLKGYIVPLLMAIMLGMGLTLSIDDFKKVLDNKKAVALGVSIQFIIMPLAAFVISKILNFQTELMVGMMLVGAAAGGTASNVMTYIAKGDLALSVSMTFVSTLLSIVLMPFLTWLYLNEQIAVPAWGMVVNLVKIILLPVSLGVIINKIFHKKIESILHIMPIISMAAIIIIIAIVVALNQKNIESVAYSVVLGVILHNLIGLACGYFFAKLFKFDDKVARTVAIEVGMQNSGLSVALALKHFSALSALPGAIFSIWHNISGSILAAFWHSKKD